MMRDMYGDESGDDILGDLLAGDDNSGYEYTEIMGSDGDDSGAFVGDGLARRGRLLAHSHAPSSAANKSRSRSANGSARVWLFLAPLCSRRISVERVR